MPEDQGSREILLGFYVAGIIIGGGILALPFVARDLGLPLLVLLLVTFGVVFHIIYIRIIDSIGVPIRDAAKVKPGLQLYDYAMERSDIGKFGKMAFTMGLLLYIIPADIVYVLYGMKSIIMLSKMLSGVALWFMVLLGLIGMIMVFVFLHYVVARKGLLYLGDAFVIKLSLMVSIWIASIGGVGIIEGMTCKVIFSATCFSASLIVGQVFPERVYPVISDIYDIQDLIPKHKVASYLTIVKVLLILLIPMAAFFIIVSSMGVVTAPSLYSSNPSIVFYSMTIIMFMYVGSGVYNILAYRWILRNIRRGKRAILIATFIAMLTYVLFTILIILSVRGDILVYADRRREHAFIALSRQLIEIGLSNVGFATIVVANIFALVSVSVAYMGFTDTLAERLNIDTGCLLYTSPTPRDRG